MGSIFGPLLHPRPLPELTFAHRTLFEANYRSFAKSEAQSKPGSHLASTGEDLRRGAVCNTPGGTQFLGYKMNAGSMAASPLDVKMSFVIPPLTFRLELSCHSQGDQLIECRRPEGHFIGLVDFFVDYPFLRAKTARR